MKHYLVNYWQDSGNTYDLAWVEAGSPIEADALGRGWNRITRKEAVRLCIEERQRRRLDEAFSGFAPIRVFPLPMLEDPNTEGDFPWWNMHTTDGYIFS